MADETTDVSSKFQMVVVLRYVHEGSPVERFWGFINPEKHDAESLTHSIRSVLDPLLKENCNKLIAQAYDGAVVMSGTHAGVHTRIREKYPLAYFVHCYAHQLNLIMSQAVSQNTQ
ncbi:zinc finger MYM-type protein 1-like, partial [Anoplophora glabripennis]|uniref:zinc finger MYM-type protein 1-like n=1 Tax=Anoplophora glabripennis TaxID=217634 RepID=UPI000C7879A4